MQSAVYFLYMWGFPLLHRASQFSDNFFVDLETSWRRLPVTANTIVRSLVLSQLDCLLADMSLLNWQHHQLPTSYIKDSSIQS